MAKKTVTVVTPALEDKADTAIVTVLKASRTAAHAAVEVTDLGTEAAMAGLPNMANLAANNKETGFTMEKIMKSAEDFVSFSQGNAEAFMKASQIWAAGVQDMGKSFAATAQAQVDAAVATMKAMSGVKSLKDAVDLQTTLARSSVETVMAETGKLTDASMKLAEQAMAPITARVTLATEKFGRAA